MLQTINLRKEYNGQVALQGLNLLIPAGEIFCMLGANGAGKSTTINLFMGFVEPTSGQVLVHNLDVATHGSETKRHIAYIPENVILYPNLTGLQNLAYFSGLSGKKYANKQLADMLVYAGLQPEAHSRKIGTYSKGMRQKVGVAIALAKQAKAFFLDEPTSGLDPLASNEFSTLIRQMTSQGVAILMATHDLFRAKQVGDRIGIMKEGQLMRVMNAADVTHTELEEIYLQVIQHTLA